jgi:hypothetical protein
MRKGPVDPKKSISPGPGAYSTKSEAFNTEKPRFYVGQKLSPLRPNTNVPGVGSYDPKPEKTVKNLPSYSMKLKLGSCLDDNRSPVPGPGNYEIHLKNLKDAPHFGFGSSKREGVVKKGIMVPGPGSYAIKSTIGDVPKYSMPGGM